MALVKQPAGGIAASGKIAGQVYARNRAGNYVRAWAKPVNPTTVRQSEVRSQFGMSATEWGMLVQSAIDNWNAYAALQSRLNRLGETYTPTGRQVFMEAAQNLAQIGEAALTNPGPTSTAPGSEAIESLTATQTIGTLTTLELGDVSGVVPSGGDGAVVIEASPVFNPSVTNVNKQFRQIGFEDGPLPIAGPTDILARYIAVFGPAANLNQLITLRLKIVDNLTGLASPWSYIKAIVA